MHSNSGRGWWAKVPWLRWAPSHLPLTPGQGIGTSKALVFQAFCSQLTKARPSEEKLACDQETSEEKVKDLGSTVLGPRWCAYLGGFVGSTGHSGPLKK